MLSSRTKTFDTFSSLLNVYLW